MKYAFIVLMYFVSWQSIICQIPVGEEPLHHILHEDATIRILEIVAMPGDTALMHRHDYNYCYVATQGGKMWLEDLGEDSREVQLPTHYAGGKSELSNGPFIHRFANIDTTAIRFFTVEHKTGIPQRIVSSSLGEDYVFKNDLFSFRKLEIAPLSSKVIVHTSLAILLNLDEHALGISGKQALEYWQLFDNEESIRVHNMENVSVSIAIFEIY